MGKSILPSFAFRPVPFGIVAGGSSERLSPMSMSPKTWFITGTSSGIGRTLTEKLLARGDRVAATVRNPDALADLAAPYGDRLWVATLDVTDTDAVRRVVDDAFAALGRIDVVINNAGYGLFGAAEEVADAQIRHQIDTNLIGSIAVVRAALPHLRAQGGGRILQVSSAGGQIAYPNFSLYHATKWGIEGFLEAVAQEVAPFDISVMIVEPGATRTRFGASLVTPETALPAYDATPAGDVRRAVAEGAFPLPGDPEKMADTIIAYTDRETVPLRLPLGSDTYTWIQAALTARLAALEAMKDVALSTDG